MQYWADYYTGFGFHRYITFDDKYFD